MPMPWYHYLVVASPGPKAGAGVASILALSEARAAGMANGPAHTVAVRAGGPAAALVKAEEYLDAQHPDLKKVISDVKR
jgi:hypothetical protein